MAKRKIHPLFFLLILVVLYWATKILNAYFISSFFKNHFTDLLFIPMQLTVCLIVLRIVKRDNKLQIPTWLVISITILMSGLFEWYLPIVKKSIHQTSDVVDVLMYLIGAILFIRLQPLTQVGG